MDNRCVVKVWRLGSYHPSQCSRKGVLQHDGKAYCKQHHPPEVKKRLNAQNEKWEEKSSARAKIHRLNRAAPELLEALKEAASVCPCSIPERESGHLTDCRAPYFEEVIAKAEESHE